MRLLIKLLLQSGLLLPVMLYGQEKGFSPGDQLNPEVISTILDAQATGAGIQKNARLFIIDFWDVACASCIAAFPKMDSLQKQFGEQIQILLVNRQSRDSTERFFKKRKKIKIPELPFISGDTMINRYFRHVGEPYHVWIDSTGKVVLMSYGHITNEKNIGNYLSAGLLPGNTRTSAIRVSSLFDERWEPSMVYYSYLSHCIENGMVKISPEHSEGLIIAGGCRSIVELYQIAYNKRNQPNYGFMRMGRTMVEIKDPYPYITPQDYALFNDWVGEHGYNYHLFIPADKDKEKFNIMREDLGRYFNIDAKVVKRPVRSLVLKKSGKNILLTSKGGEAKDNFQARDRYSLEGDSLRYYINKPYEGLSRRMEYMIENKFKQPFIDSTNIKGNVDIVLSGSALDSADLKTWRMELKKYGLVLVEKEMVLEVLVIKKRE
ncbi:MAG: thioredoxin family protein [Chitinophagaceae bacterium]